MKISQQNFFGNQIIEVWLGYKTGLTYSINMQASNNHQRDHQSVVFENLT